MHQEGIIKRNARTAIRQPVGGLTTISTMVVWLIVSAAMQRMHLQTIMADSVRNATRPVIGALMDLTTMGKMTV
jgi:hypothetical protein